MIELWKVSRLKLVAIMDNKKTSSILPYIQIARPDHWFKNVFMLPGVILAIFDAPVAFSWGMLPSLLLSVLAACLVASSNYVINEIIDAPMDSLHPVKKERPIPLGRVHLPFAYAECLLLAIAGLLLAWQINYAFFFSAVALLFMGILYNIPPIRLKDIPYIDVLSESINNPIRLFLGWFAVQDVHIPTLSLIMAYWMIGAFFMATKRYAECRRIGDKAIAENYRKSFSYYTECRLMLSILYYATAFGLFFGIFLIRYRIELILSIPFLAGFMSMYMRMGFWENSPVQYPEQLYKQRGFAIYTIFCFLFMFSLLFIDVPIISKIFSPLHMPGE